MTIQIVKEVLAEQVNEGMKMDELAAHYSLPVAQMKKALKACGLKIRRFHKPKFEIISNADIATVATESVEVVEEQVISLGEAGLLEMEQAPVNVEEIEENQTESPSGSWA